jgi:hypothetical protein
LGLPEDALTAQMKKPQGATAQARMLKPEGSPARPVQDASRRAEMLLIGLMMESVQYAQSASHEIQPEDFLEPAARKAAEAIFENLKETTGAARIMNRYPEDADVVKLVSTAAAETDSIVDKTKTLDDCLAWMKRARTRAEQESLKREIADAQKSGDKNRLKDLLAHFNELNRGMKK